MKRENQITENLAIGLLNTDKPLVFAVLNTANYDVMGYCFVAGDSPNCLETVGCFDEDIIRADKLKVGESLSSEEWPAENAVIILKMKDARTDIE